MEVSSFSEIEEEFQERVKKIVWCTVTSIDRKNRPRSRILHPIWDGPSGYIATGRHSHKAKHFEHNPYVSLTYWDPDHKQIYAECRVSWEDSAEEKARVWELYKSTPEPLGYDLNMFWPGGATDANYGLMKLSPWRIELSALSDLVTGKEPIVFRPAL